MQPRVVQLEFPIETKWCQRSTTGGRQTWRYAAHLRVNPDHYFAARISQAEAKAWIVPRHYSHSYPKDRLRYGLFDVSSGQPVLVGVAVLSVPMSRFTLPNAFPTLEPNFEALELGRFYLDDSVPGNGESMSLGMMMRLAAEDGVRGLVAFADPVPRFRADGTKIFAGHHGVIYWATNFIYTGRSKPQVHIILPDDTILSPRTKSKIRNGESGWEAAEARLVALGATPRRRRQLSKVWLNEALNEVDAREFPHGGNHRYTIRVGRNRAERSRVTIGYCARAFPKPHNARDELARPEGRSAYELNLPRRARLPPAPSLRKRPCPGRPRHPSRSSPLRDAVV